MKQMVITNDRTRTRFNIQKNMFLSCFNGVRKCLQYFTLQESSVTNLLNSRVHFIWCLHLSDQSARLAPEAGDLGICGGGWVEGAGGGGGGGGDRRRVWRVEARGGGGGWSPITASPRTARTGWRGRGGRAPRPGRGGGRPGGWGAAARAAARRRVFGRESICWPATCYDVIPVHVIISY